MFASNLFRSIKPHASYIFNILIFLLVICFVGKLVYLCTCISFTQFDWFGDDIPQSWSVLLCFYYGTSRRVLSQVVRIKPINTFTSSVQKIEELTKLVDSLREMRKYDTGGKDLASMSTHPNVVEHAHMKMFRAQRNFYIAGFSLFLWL